MICNDKGENSSVISETETPHQPFKSERSYVFRHISFYSIVPIENRDDLVSPM
jgi:hypothetical protein